MDTDNHQNVNDAAPEELQDDQLDNVTGGIIAILIGLLLPAKQS